MQFDTKLSDVKGVGPVLASKYAGLGLHTIADLLQYYPRNYEDYSAVMPIRELQPGAVTIEAEITSIAGRYVRRGMHITEAIASDGTASVRLVWFNQPYRLTGIKTDQPYFISGDFSLKRGRMALTNPSLELKSDMPLNTARILPIYRETKGLTSRQIRKTLATLRALMRTLPETLPKWVVDKAALISYAEAMDKLHFPHNAEDLVTARRRLGFEEVFHLTLASLLNKQANQQEVSLSVRFDQKLAQKFVSELPFELTDGQRVAAWQIYQDMERVQPMNRLLEGDVGSGKTVVATMAALMAMSEGYQIALMAPTELLAQQHAKTIYTMLKPLGLSDQVLLLTGSLKPAQKRSAHEAIAKGKTRFMIGTHALIQEKVDMHSLALIVVDEQHRFGVDQRKQLMSKAGHMPHVLSMTATPIPRSLALTLYGELDISVLTSKPSGRLPIVTELIPPSSRPKLYTKVKEELKNGKQVFVVCPLISDSETLGARSAETVFQELSTKDFKSYRVGLLHGKLKADDKNQIMQDFIDKKIDILVSTTVIEVGVDVPNASVMLIESPERFGLAQIHQLRGRVGRSSDQGYCYLMLSDAQAPGRRLRELARTTDGFKLAELDMEIRGPGAIYGTMQHGALDLRIAKLSDTKLIAEARAMAQQFIDSDENLVHYTQLSKQVTRLRAVTNLN